MTSSTENKGILDGIRILDFSQVLAGPYCSRILADMGAEVIKVERPPGGDGLREMPAMKNGVSGFFMLCNAGKKSLCIDLKKSKSIAIIKELVKQSDVVLENFNVGAMARMGLGYDDLQKENPRLIMCSISGYGQSGPNKNQLAFATVIHAATGVTEIMRRLHGENIPPAPQGMSLGDTIAGYHAAGAIMGALFYRERTGIGQYIDISMFDSLFFTVDFHVQYYLMTKEEHPIFGSIPLKGRDGYLNIGIGKYEMISRIFECMGKPELRNDPRFNTIENVNSNKFEFRDLIEGWLQKFETVEEAEALLHKAGLGVSKVRSIVEAIHSDQVESRGLLVEVDHPKIGKIKVMNTPFKFSATRSGLRGLQPELGEHNKDVLSRILRYSNDGIEKLYADKVLFSKS